MNLTRFAECLYNNYIRQATTAKPQYMKLRGLEVVPRFQFEDMELSNQAYKVKGPGGYIVVKSFAYSPQGLNLPPLSIVCVALFWRM